MWTSSYFEFFVSLNSVLFVTADSRPRIYKRKGAEIFLKFLLQQFHLFTTQLICYIFVHRWSNCRTYVMYIYILLIDIKFNVAGEQIIFKTPSNVTVTES